MQMNLLLTNVYYFRYALFLTTGIANNGYTMRVSLAMAIGTFDLSLLSPQCPNLVTAALLTFDLLWIRPDFALT